MVPQVILKHPGQPLTCLPWRSRGPGRGGRLWVSEMGFFCPSCFPRCLERKPAPVAAHWEVLLKSTQGKKTPPHRSHRQVKSINGLRTCSHYLILMLLATSFEVAFSCVSP